MESRVDIVKRCCAEQVHRVEELAVLCEVAMLAEMSVFRARYTTKVSLVSNLPRPIGLVWHGLHELRQEAPKSA